MNELNELIPWIAAHKAELKKPGVLSVLPGYKSENGWLTKQRAAVVTVAAAGDLALPAGIEGIPVDVRKATPLEELRFQEPATFAKLAEHRAEFRGGAFPGADPAADEIEPELERGKPQIPYTPPDGVALQPVTGNIPITCHVSPDAGWPTLHGFLASTQSTLTVGLYDFTSKHILDGVEQALLNRQFEIVLDSPAKNPTADQTDPETLDALASTLGLEFKSAVALVRSNKAIQNWIYPTAYHIKVAVRDSQALWLSSGNWNNSNQPDIDPINSPAPDDQATARESDRDWHVIIEDPGLAQTYEAFLKHDFDVATSAAGGERGLEAEVAEPEGLRSAAPSDFEFHAPLRIEDEVMTITPLLTPDPGVYQPAMLSLLQSAQTSLYIQLQYIHPSNKAEDADFNALIDAVVAKIQAGVDVRIILSQWQLSQGWLDRLQAAGVDLKVVKIQNGVHNKGFVVDSKVVALGSQNWSAEGVLRNRDASVIIENATAAQYYEKIFLHDWDRIARQSVQ